MRNCCRGESLTNTELQEIANNYTVSFHASQRMTERGLSEDDIVNIILNPLIAYFNTDGSINIAKDKDHYLVVAYNSYKKNYNIITYKEPSLNGKDIFEKRKLARKGVRRTA